MVYLDSQLVKILVFVLLSACSEEKVRRLVPSNQSSLSVVLTVMLVPGSFYAFLRIPRHLEGKYLNTVT